MCIFFENENFNSGILSIIGDYNINSNQKKNTVFNSHWLHGKKSTHFFNLNGLTDLKPPTKVLVEYVLINYGFDLSELERKDQDNSLNLSEVDCSEYEEEEDLAVLNNFESDLLETREFYIEKSFENDFNYHSPPRRGSNSYTLNSRDYTSAFSSDLRNSRISLAKSLTFNTLNKSSNVINRFRSSSEQKSTNVSALRVNSAQSRYNSLLEMSGGSGCFEIQEEEHLIEEVFVFKGKNVKKKYTLFIIKGYLVLLKKNPDGNHKGFSKIKKIIPLKRLYKGEVEESVVMNEMIYTKLNLISTIKPNREVYTFYFEGKRRSDEVIRIIQKQTGFVSMKSEYEYIKEIARGGFSEIKLVSHKKTGKQYAVKKLKKVINSIEDFTCLNWEKDIVTFLKNAPGLENIIKYERIVETSEHLYIIMEYVESKSLLKFLQKTKMTLTPSFIREVVKQISNGIKQLHSYGIIHRDLKLENVLIDYKDNKNFCVKIIDFGLSKVLSPKEKANETFGTLYYSSPEILLHRKYDFKVDVWCLGIMTYYLRYRCMPFGIKGSENNKEVCQMILKNQLKGPQKSDVQSPCSKEECDDYSVLRNLIVSCLYKDYNKRPTIEDVYNTLVNN